MRKAFGRILRRERNKSSDGNIWLALVAWRLGQLKIASLISRKAASLAPGKEDRRLAGYLNGLAELHLNGGFRDAVRQSLASVLPGFRPGVPIVVVPVSRNYIDLFRLWAGQVTKHISASVLVIALDRDSTTSIVCDSRFTFVDLSQYFLVEDSGRLHRHSRSHLWILRTFVVRELVTLGWQVIVLDLDAMPVNDVSAMLSDLPKADIVAQIEPRSIPADAARKLGFILCCGFMVFYPTEATRRFMDRYAEKVVMELDDQVALNHILVEEGHPKLVRNSRWSSFESAGVRWSCPSAELVSRNEFQGGVIRHFQQTGQTIDELKIRLGILVDI